MSKVILIAAAIIMAVVWRAYSPGLMGPFLYDDFANVTSNLAIKIDELSLDSIIGAMESGRAGPLRRPISMASFALDHAYAGLDPTAFKRTNLLIHLLCGLLVASLSFLLTRRIFWREAPFNTHLSLALIVASVWLLHPLQLTNVLYVVQRMNSLAGLFTLGALVLYVAARFPLKGPPRPLGAAKVSAVIFLTLCAILSKENGVLVVTYIAAIELSARYALPSPTRDLADRTFLIITGIGTLTALALWATFHERLQASYFNRDFTLAERVLTQPRVLLWYIKLMVLPNITDMGLIHDYWTKSSSLMQPASTLAAILVWILAALLAWLMRFKAPLVLFSLLWFLGGHALESTVWPLLLVFEHRNYIPFFGIVFAICTLSARMLNNQPVPARVLPALLVIAALYNLTRDRAHIWSEDTIWIQTQARNHPESAGAQYLKGDLFAQFASYVSPEQREKVIKTADEAFQQAWELNPRDISPLLARTYHWQRLGLKANEDDLRHAAAQVERGHVPVPAQNAVLVFCQQIRDGDTLAADDLHKSIISATLRNPMVSEYIRERLRACEIEVSKQSHTKGTQ